MKSMHILYEQRINTKNNWNLANSFFDANVSLKKYEEIISLLRNIIISFYYLTKSVCAIIKNNTYQVTVVENGKNEMSSSFKYMLIKPKGQGVAIKRNVAIFFRHISNAR